MVLYEEEASCVILSRELDPKLYDSSPGSAALNGPGLRSRSAWLALWINYQANLPNQIVYFSRMSLDEGSDICMIQDISSSYELSIMQSASKHSGPFSANRGYDRGYTQIWAT